MCTYIYAYICTYMYIYICMHICIYMYIRTYRHVYRYVRIHMYICKYVYICLHRARCDGLGHICMCTLVRGRDVEREYESMCACASACVRACVHACLRACAWLCARVCSRVSVCVCLCSRERPPMLRQIFFLIGASALFFFVDGYCSTVQGSLDWFEVDLGFTELSFIQIDLCVLCFFVLYSRVSLSSCPFSDIQRLRRIHSTAL